MGGIRGGVWGYGGVRSLSSYLFRGRAKLTTLGKYPPPPPSPRGGGGAVLLRVILGATNVHDRRVGNWLAENMRNPYHN